MYDEQSDPTCSTWLQQRGSLGINVAKFPPPNAYRLHNYSLQGTLSFVATNFLYSSDPLVTTKKRLSSCFDYRISTTKKKLYEPAASLSSVHKLFAKKTYLNSSCRPKYLNPEKATLYSVASAKTETAKRPQQTKASKRGPAKIQTDKLASKKCQDF